VVAAVAIERLAGNEPCGIVRQERGGDAHIIDADEAAPVAFALAMSSTASNSGIPDAALRPTCAHIILYVRKVKSGNASS
jgi:hypothetical protein